MNLYINKNLLTLKCVIFLFCGAIGSLFPFLIIHMTTIGLSKDESIVVTAISAFVASLGPFIACPLADRLAGGFGGTGRSKTGKYLRMMIAICLLLATLFYWLLITVSPINRSQLNVTFVCDQNGGYIIQDRCGKDRTCYNWDGEKGSITVSNCFYACSESTPFPVSSTHYGSKTTTTASPSNTNDYDTWYGNDNNEGDSSGISPVEVIPDAYEDRYENKAANIISGMFPHPHMCYQNNTNQICEVYTKYTKSIEFSIGLHSNKAENTDGNCTYQFRDPFHCRITSDVLRLLNVNEHKECHPMVLCQINDPYSEDSLLYGSQCGSYDNITYFLYILIRSFGDIFTAAAVALLATAIVIATRETSTGRGDIGQQLVFGALGLAIFPPIIGGLGKGMFASAMISFTVLMVLAALILLFDNNMPLSPPEWWWHTRCGLLALPMSSVRKYGLETAALVLVLLLLGIFWNAIDAFMPWHISDLYEGSHLIIGLTVTIGAVPAVLYLIFAERFVDYCGHCNILIACFVNYIIHHIGLIHIKEAPLLLICELLEIFTLHIMYATAVMYMRHIVPRKFTACGQGLPLISHFCIGRGIGALIGGLAYSEHKKNFTYIHMWFAIAAAVVSVIYFLAYHLFLKPKCTAAAQVPPYPAPPIVQSMNGNGSYAPLRVYHHGKAKKGHFRY